MAILKKGILGTPKGKIGSIVGYQRNGRGVIQSVSKNLGDPVNNSLYVQGLKIKGLFSFFSVIPVGFTDVSWRNYAYKYGWSSEWLSQKNDYMLPSGIVDYNLMRIGNNEILDNLSVVFNSAFHPALYRTQVSGLSSYYPLDSTYTARVIAISYDLTQQTNGSALINNDSMTLSFSKSAFTLGTPFWMNVIVYSASNGMCNSGYVGNDVR